MPGHGLSAAVLTLLVQTAVGFNHAEGQAAGIEGPKELPAQMLDHATGYFMAFGAMMAKARQSRDMRQLACPGVAGADRALAVESRPSRRRPQDPGFYGGGRDCRSSRKLPSGFGPLQAVRHSARAVEDPGVLGPSGDAARQPSAAMAGAGLAFSRAFSRVALQTLTPNAKAVRRFLGCLKRQLGTISAPMRQSLPKSSPT